MVYVNTTEHFDDSTTIYKSCTTHMYVRTFGKLGGATIQGLFKQIPRSLQLFATVTINELGKISVPDIIDIWPPEQSNTTLICLKDIDSLG